MSVHSDLLSFFFCGLKSLILHSAGLQILRDEVMRNNRHFNPLYQNEFVPLPLLIGKYYDGKQINTGRQS
jgi:hypothetical protein